MRRLLYPDERENERGRAVMILRKLEQEEHGKTRALWEEIFSTDTKAFLDYYYYIKARDNQIWVIEEDEQICSMLQLNPYTVRVESKEFPSAYIIAVATKEAYRGRGYMGALLRRTLEEMYSRKMPFTFLMPAAEAIYTPYDFRFIYTQDIGELVSSGKGRELAWKEGKDTDTVLPSAADAAGAPVEAAARGNLTFSDAGLWDAEMIAEFFEKYFAGRYQVCTVRNAAYWRTMILEQGSERGGMRLIQENGDLKGIYAYGREEELEIREPFLLDGYKGAFLKSVSELSQGVAESSQDKEKSVPVYACPPGCAAEKKPLIMARIVCLPELLAAMRAPEDEEVSCSFAVIDPLLTKNSRVWKVESAFGETALHVRETEDSEGVLPVAELTEVLFGRISPEEAAEREGVILSERLVEELNKITKLTRTWFNEVV